MRTTTNINFYCRKSKANRFGESPVEISLGLNGTRKFFQTSVKCDHKVFGTDRQPEAVTKYIYSLRQNLLNSIADLTAQGTPLTADTLKRVIQRGGVNSYTLKDLYDDFNKILNMRQKAGKITLPAKNKYILVQNLFSKDFPLDRQVSDITQHYSHLLSETVIDEIGSLF